VGTGLAALSRIDFTGVDYRQHPIATIAGTFLPSVIGGVIAYFIAPRIFPNFKVNPNIARLGWKELLAVLAVLIVAIGVGSIVISQTKDKHKENPFAQFDPRIVGDLKPGASNNSKQNPFDAIDDKDEPPQASPRMQCFRKAQTAYNSVLMALLNTDPFAALSDGGRSVTERRWALETYCSSIANCQFERSNAFNYTQTFSYCIRSVEKDNAAIDASIE
jgi:hypothetical protein